MLDFSLYDIESRLLKHNALWQHGLICFLSVSSVIPTSISLSLSPAHINGVTIHQALATLLRSHEN